MRNVEPAKRPQQCHGLANRQLHDHGASLTKGEPKVSIEACSIPAPFASCHYLPLAFLVGFRGQTPTCSRNMFQKQPCKPATRPKAVPGAVKPKPQLLRPQLGAKGLGLEQQPTAPGTLQGCSRYNITWGAMTPAKDAAPVPYHHALRTLLQPEGDKPGQLEL